MKTIARYLARKANRVAFGLWMCILATGLSGCTSPSQTPRTPIERLNFNDPSPTRADGVQQGLSPADYDPQYKESSPKLGLSEDEAKALGCDLGDRFDRGATLAYTFDDRKSRVALNLSLDGPSLSNPSRLQVNSVMIRFTHRFQKPLLGKKEKCLMPSNFQGMIGSGYNEFFLRNNFTIWKDLRNRLNMAQ